MKKGFLKLMIVFFAAVWMILGITTIAYISSKMVVVETFVGILHVVMFLVGSVLIIAAPIVFVINRMC